MNEKLLEFNQKIYNKLNIPLWHTSGINGKGVKIAVIGYGGCLAHKKPYLINVNNVGTGSYHDGDEIIHAVAPDAKIYSLNTLDKNGWSFGECLNWALNNDIDIICSSLILYTWSWEWEEIAEKLWNKGVIMIDSSDNEAEAGIGYPAKCPYWFAVGAYNGEGRAGYSGYGEELACLMYTGLVVEAQENYYVDLTNTSGATQCVAGMAALLKEKFRIKPLEFDNFLQKYCHKIGKEVHDIYTGYGLFVLPAQIPKSLE